jgi:hypothetical protein
MTILLTVLLLAVSQPVDPAVSLGQFAGHWELAGQSITSKGTSTYKISEDCQWSDRRAFMVCEQNEHGKAVNNATLMWFDASTKHVRFTGVSLDGSAYSGTILIAGDTWTWGSAAAGKDQFRTINRWTSPDRIEYTSQNSRDGGKNWVTDGTGTETRVLPH